MEILKKILMRPVFRHRLLFGIMLPVIAAGLVFSFVLNSIFLPPMIVHLKNMNDSILRNSAAMEISFCEDKFTYLLDLRMEENKEMNLASKKEDLERINAISRRFPKVRMMVLNKKGKILAATFKPLYFHINPHDLDQFLYPGFDGKKIISLNLFKDKVMANLKYFPFYQWTIISFIPSKDYMAPIIAAEKTVRFGTFGTVIITGFVLLLLFLMKINTPLKNIIKATDKVSKGDFNPIEVKGHNEISHLSSAFNSMIKSLEADKMKISAILHDLSESEDKYRSLAENSLAVIAIMQKGRIIYANKAMSDLLKYDLNSLKIKKIQDLVCTGDYKKTIKKLNRLENGESEKEYCKSCFKIKNGEIIFLEILASSISVKGSRAVLLHGIDITEKKIAEDEQKELKKKLTRAEKMELVGTLAGGVAHDLNNILSGIVSYPELLLMDIQEDAPLYKPLSVIKQSGVKAAAIVQDMLTLTRRGVVVKKTVDLNTIINTYLKSPEFKNLQSFHNRVNIDFNPAPDLMRVNGSPVHLSKTVMNLVGNAAEAMPEGGIISIATKNYFSCKDKSTEKTSHFKQGHYAVISVSDTGTGISHEDMDKIFEPFYTKKVMGRSGTGLGMSVVWGTVKDHDGYIDVKSTKGKGTCFTLYFPAAEKEKNSIASEAAPFSLEQYRGKGQTVLVVDDVENQRIIASGILEKLGYNVKTASTGEQAVEYMKDHTADLVILDMIMDPGIDGLETYQKILEIHPGQKGIIASGFSENSRVKEAERLGINAYVKKPYAFEQIAVAVKKALQNNKNHSR